MKPPNHKFILLLQLHFPHRIVLSTDINASRLLSSPFFELCNWPFDLFSSVTISASSSSYLHLNPQSESRHRTNGIALSIHESPHSLLLPQNSKNQQRNHQHHNDGNQHNHHPICSFHCNHHRVRRREHYLSSPQQPPTFVLVVQRRALHPVLCGRLRHFKQNGSVLRGVVELVVNLDVLGVEEETEHCDLQVTVQRHLDETVVELCLLDREHLVFRHHALTDHERVFGHVGGA